MPASFFAASEFTARETTSGIPKCGACGLLKTCQSPKMPVDGEGRRKILIVGEAPGEQEDQRGRPLVGPTGQHLEKALARVGVDMRRDCWLTNALICRPPKNATPDHKRIGYCRPNLINTIRKLQPAVIIPLGHAAVESLIGWLWKEDTGPIARWLGWNIPCQALNCWICPTWHPAFLLGDRSGKGNEVAGQLFEHHLEKAVEHTKCPWTDVPNYADEVEVLFNPHRAAKIIKQMMERGGVVAFDYETNMVKPDSTEAKIVSCSVSWMGKRTIAYTWQEPAISATRELLRSPLGKIGSNIKFEERWTIRHLNTRVRNWRFDTMLGGHVLDNRPGITGLKFQSFVEMGAPSYDDSIKPYLKARSANTPNRIHLIPLPDLLKYNGLDSLLEFRLAQIQAKRLRVPLKGTP